MFPYREYLVVTLPPFPLLEPPFFNGVPALLFCLKKTIKYSAGLIVTRPTLKSQVFDLF